MKVSKSMDPKRLERFKNVWVKRMEDKAGSLEYLRDKERGVKEVRGPVEMLAEVLREQKELFKDELNFEDDEGEELGEWIPEGLAIEVLERIEESKRIRESIGWGGDLDVVDHEVDSEEINVPLDYMEAHERLIEETRELRRGVEQTLGRSQGLRSN